jgi:3-oxoacyl-[acyl-carrier-protein] synthase III
MSKKVLAAITGVGGYVPDYILTNAELEKMVDTNDEWITSRTGIKERRILKTPGLACSDMGVEAVRRLLEKTNTRPDEIEMLICGTVTGDMKFPDTANSILYKVGATKAFGFDVNAACSGFLYSLHLGSKMIESGTYKKIIVVGADMMSSITDYTDRATCILFGDGAGAVMLEPREDGMGIQDAILRADGVGKEFLNLKAGGSFMPTTHETVDQRLHYAFQDGRPVFKAAVNGMTSTMGELLERNHLTGENIDWIVPHQANMRIITAVSQYSGVPMEKVMVNIDRYGNTTSATIPLCLWDFEDKLKKGDTIMFTAFGGGFTWGSILLKWAY